MNYWHFKFTKPELNFKELKSLQDGDIFFTEITQNHILKKVGTNTIVFWSRGDKDQGIYLVSRILGEPYECDKVSSTKAIPLKVIQKFEKPFVLQDQGFVDLHEHLNTTLHKGRVASRMSIDDIKKGAGEKLLYKMLPKYQEPETNYDPIDTVKIKETLQLFCAMHQNYLEQGNQGKFYNIFIEANIAAQEIRHSSYLADLLNKDGKHFQGTLFLASLINELRSLYNFEALEKIDIDNCIITTEEYNAQNDKKGLMDIVIKDEHYAIIIENKTGTKDAKGQLLKYNDFVQVAKQYENVKAYVILYLTPNGEDPLDEEARDTKEIVPISYSTTIKNSMQNSLKSISNERVKDLIKQYIDAIELYAYNLPTDWLHQLLALELIIEDEENFRQCEWITKMVNYNTIDAYGFTAEEIQRAKWIATNFIKAKSHLERLFFVSLHNEIRDFMQSKSFYYSQFSNILSELLLEGDNIDMTIAIDIQTIHKARKNRLACIAKNKPQEYYEKLRENSKTCLMYEKRVAEDEVVFVSIQKDVSGLYILTERLKDDAIEIVGDVTYIYDGTKDILHPQEIIKLLDEEELSKIIQECTMHLHSQV